MVKISLSSLVIFSCVIINVRQCLSLSNTFTKRVRRGATVHQLIQGSKKFSFELLRTLNAKQTTLKNSKDLFFSPHSIWSALLVTYMGARGLTRHEMEKVLGVGVASKSETWRAFRSIRYYNPSDKPVYSNFNSANRIYFQKGTTLKKYMQKVLNKNVAYVDFQNHTDEARRAINSWVERYTHRRIRNLLPPHSIDRMTKMVIANAVYFREEWLQPFEPQNTSRRKFTTSLLKTIFATMMSTRGMFLHGRSKELRCSILEIPYSNNDMSMVIILPDKIFYGLDNLVNKLSPDTLKYLQESMLPKDVTVSIPKFKVEDTYELSSVLRDMGLKTLFDTRRVNLSGFTGRRELRLDSVRHKTLIDVNELGTEAAASTDMFFFRSAVPSEKVMFIANHPFVYFIQDNVSNTILFLGTIRQPPVAGFHF